MSSDRFSAVRRAGLDVAPTPYFNAVEHGERQRQQFRARALAQAPEQPQPDQPDPTMGERWRALSIELATEWMMSKDWADALAAVILMSQPKVVNQVRWLQIVTDAEAFVTTCHAHADDQGWTVADVFAFDPDDDDGRVGLLPLIQGGRCLVAKDEITIVRQDGMRRIYRRQVPDGMPPIWTLNKRQKGRSA